VFQLPVPVTSSVTSTSLRVSWSPAPGSAISYDVERNSRRICCSAQQAVTTIVDDGLLPYTNYMYTVRAINAEGEGNWSDVATIRTAVAAPSGLIPPTLTKVGAGGCQWSKTVHT
jgi:predicted phage tail protein